MAVPLQSVDTSTANCVNRVFLLSLQCSSVGLPPILLPTIFPFDQEHSDLELECFWPRLLVSVTLRCSICLILKMMTRDPIPCCVFCSSCRVSPSKYSSARFNIFRVEHGNHLRSFYYFRYPDRRYRSTQQQGMKATNRSHRRIHSLSIDTLPFTHNDGVQISSSGEEDPVSCSEDRIKW